MKLVHLSLGSNLGDRAGHLRRALDELAMAGIEVARVSAFYRTEPVDYRPQPWFLNAVAEIRTELLPLRLLSTLQRIERKLGRRRAVPKGPRTIDLDILFYDNAVVRTSALTIPHPRMEERKFVLAPLSELAPDLRHPVTRKTVREMLSDTADRSQIMRYEQSSG
jgi:2-amino-4-hydroxy-6-hydroxymethyldihydropteridine diphosphokinase